MNDTHPLIMLGVASETRGSAAAAIEAYRADGLFKRWPVEYVPTICGGGMREEAALLWRSVRRFGELLGRHRQAVVHAHFCARAGFWRQAAFAGLALSMQRPLIVQLHGGGFESFYDRCGTPSRAAIDLLLRRAAAIVVPCHSLLHWVQRLARDAKAICVPAPVAVNAAAADLATRPNVVLSLARLERDKGIFDLLDAMAAVRAAVPDARLVCAGDGDRDAVRAAAERLGIRDAVKFVGWVGPSGKRALLENAAVLALPSYVEGLPASLLEGMAAGVPVVASSVGGMPEIVADGATGLLAAPGDKGALARHLRRLLLDRALGARIGAAGREAVRARHAAERVVPQLEHIYKVLGVGALAERPAPMEMRKAA